MAGLQRSAVSFRRQGSSGLVWDDRYFSGELTPTMRRHEEQPQRDALFLSGELRPSRNVGSASTFERSRSSASHRIEAISPSRSPSAANPSSPKFTGCGFCGVFGRPIGGARHHKSKR
ncbi:MAPK kinase substrate protein At1g80180-like [Cucurbita pepo subsp. pepo]|uniref:MAPK kinase substrate protein At1g80180-like n=1 Tax=Cucurbita pepo subsp. pepo TaxID=3664 RepID=UPI000C9D643B|nr:MAPK kinase substrate protein At1g80180-like [Cucurbita pepo subsp. pepo]